MTTNTVESLISIKGKTIENITARTGDNGFREITLFFTDGSEKTFSTIITFHGNDQFPAEAEIEVE